MSYNVKQVEKLWRESIPDDLEYTFLNVGKRFLKFSVCGKLPLFDEEGHSLESTIEIDSRVNPAAIWNAKVLLDHMGSCYAAMRVRKGQQVLNG